MKVERLELLHLRMPLVRPVETPQGPVRDHEVLLVRAESGGVSGYGEVPATAFPGRSYETVQTAWHVIRDFMAGRLRGREFAAPGPVSDLFALVHGHPMAKAAVEGAVLDLFGRLLGKPLSRLLGGERDEVPCAVTLDGPGDLLERVGEAVARRYQRIGVSIRPRQDLEVLAAVRRRFGEIPLAADAGGSYSLSDEERLKQLDEFGLVMVEQPLASDAGPDHARLQSRMKTPLALGDSIRSYEQARRALELGCRAINLRPSWVGGPYAAKMVHNQARARGVALGIGGLLQTGIGRAHDLALASLPHFTLAAEIDESARWFAEDVIDPPLALTPQATLEVPRGAGIGDNVSERVLSRTCVRREYALC